MPTIPSKDEIDYFQQNGVVCLRHCLEPIWTDLLQRGFVNNMNTPGPYACYYTDQNAPGLFRDDYCNWQRIPEFKQVIFHSNLAQLAAVLLGTQTIRFFHEHIFLKLKGTVKKTPWHQDLPYFCVDGDQGISFWIPLTAIDESNKLEFIAGSHRWGLLFTPKKFNGVDSYDVPNDLYAHLPDFDNRESPHHKLSWTMEVGDVLAFDFRTVHGNTESGHANTADRRSIALRFLGENMRYSQRPGEKSPPFPEVSLPKGAVLDHPSFPIVWPNALTAL